MASLSIILDGKVGWRNTLLVIGSFGAIAVLACLIFVKEPRSKVSGSSSTDTIHKRREENSMSKTSLRSSLEQAVANVRSVLNVEQARYIFVAATLRYAAGFCIGVTILHANMLLKTCIRVFLLIIVHDILIILSLCKAYGKLHLSSRNFRGPKICSLVCLCAPLNVFCSTFMSSIFLCPYSKYSNYLICSKFIAGSNALVVAFGEYLKFFFSLQPFMCYHCCKQVVYCPVFSGDTYLIIWQIQSPELEQ